MDESIILEKLAELRERYRKTELIDRILRFMYIFSIPTIIIIIILKILGLEYPYILYGTIPLAFGIIIPMSLFFFEKISFMKIALLADERYQMKERLSTVVEWIDQKRKRTLMFKGLLKDTAIHAGKIQSNDAFPFTFRKRFTVLLIIMPVIAILVFTPAWGLIKYFQPPKDIKIIRETAGEIEEIPSKLNLDLRKNDAKKTLKTKSIELKNLAKEIKKPNIDKMEAIAKISSLKEKYSDERKKIQNEKSLLNKLNRTALSTNSGKSGSNNGRKAIDKIKEMQKTIKNGEHADMKKVKDSLSKFQKAAGSDNNLSKEINDAICGIESGNPDASGEALDRASQRLENMETDSNTDSDLKNIIRELEKCKNQISGNNENEPGKSAGLNEKDTIEGEHGESGEDDNGDNKESGTSGNESSGKGKNSKTSKTGEKVPADFGVGSTNKKGSPGEKPPDYFILRQSEKESRWKEFYDKLYKGERENISSASTKVKGQFQGARGIKTRIEERGGIPIPHLVRNQPEKVYSAYKGKAEEAINNEQIPNEYKSIVREYFKGINPSK